MKINIMICLALGLICGCGPNDENISLRERAQQLNDSAVNMVNASNHDSMAHVNAISILDQATQTDSSFTQAYWNKLSFLMETKQFTRALETVKLLNQRNPNYIQFYTLAGELYDITGDSVNARKYYKEAITHYNTTLDTMQKGLNYSSTTFEKAIILILNKEQAKGNELLKKLYSEETNPDLKSYYEKYIGMSRAEILQQMSTGKTN